MSRSWSFLPTTSSQPSRVSFLLWVLLVLVVNVSSLHCSAFALLKRNNLISSSSIMGTAAEAQQHPLGRRRRHHHHNPLRSFPTGGQGGSISRSVVCFHRGGNLDEITPDDDGDTVQTYDDLGGENSATSANPPQEQKRGELLQINGEPTFESTLEHDDNVTSTSLAVVQSMVSNIRQYVDKNFFLVGMFIAVILAATFPSLGQNGGVLRPELFIGNYGVSLIFLLSGLSLQTSELAQAIGNVKLNGLVQVFLFAVWPFCIGVPLRRILQSLFVPLGLLTPALADGILITTTLPTTVNMCIMLTSASGGNVAAAICNAVLSNMGGILITPLLLLHFFGASIQLPFTKMVWKLCQKVLFPVAVGQILRTTKVKEFYQQKSKFFKRLQEVILLGIVYNAFCNAFSGEGLGLALKHTLVLLALLPTLHLAALGATFKFFSIPRLNFSRSDTVAAMFCSSQKTLAFGLPLINTIFQGNVNLAAYVAPIMFIHPLQMTIGSLLLPAIQRYTNNNEKKE